MKFYVYPCIYNFTPYHWHHELQHNVLPILQVKSYDISFRNPVSSLCLHWQFFGGRGPCWRLTSKVFNSNLIDFEVMIIYLRSIDHMIVDVWCGDISHMHVDFGCLSLYHALVHVLWLFIISTHQENAFWSWLNLGKHNNAKAPTSNPGQPRTCHDDLVGFGSLLVSLMCPKFKMPYIP